jgi:RNA-directed DNA polymerase
MDMLRERIDDRPCLGRIRPWLKAGGLDTDGQGLPPVTGLPQGGIGSPVLAKLYLHHALDRGCAEVVQPHGAGQAAVCR